MNLEPRAKAVRIRILSNGKENSSLEELKSNFDLEAVIGLMSDDRLFRWLRQRNEIELANSIKQIGEPSTILDKYIKIISRFFPNIKETDSPIEVIKFSFAKDTSSNSHNGYILLSAILESKRTECIRPAILQFWNELESASGKFQKLVEDFCRECANSDKTNGENTYMLRKKLPNAAETIRSYLLLLANEKGCEEAKKEMEAENAQNEIVSRDDLKILVRMIEDARLKVFDYDKYYEKCKTKGVLIDSFLLIHNICREFKWCEPHKLSPDVHIQNREIANLDLIAKNIIDGRKYGFNPSYSTLCQYKSIVNKYDGVECVKVAFQKYQRAFSQYYFICSSLDKLASLFIESKNNRFIQMAIETCFDHLPNDKICSRYVLDELLDIVLRIKQKYEKQVE